MSYKLVGSGVKSVSLADFDAWMDAQINEQLEGMDGYSAVAWAYRCVNMRCNALAGIPRQIVRAGSEDEVEFEFDLTRLLWNIEGSLQLFGAAYVLKQTNRVALKGFQLLNAQTMTPIIDPWQGITGFEQRIAGKKRFYAPGQIIYVHTYNPNDDLGPGISPMKVCELETGLAINLNTWASKFFEQGAIPALLLHTDSMLPPGEVERVEKGWARMLQGVQNAWKAIVLQGGLKPEVVGQPVKDLVVPELSHLIREQIATAFGVPQTLLSDAANYATAVEHKMSFYNETIIPETDLIGEAFNVQLFDAMGLELQFRPEELDIYQEDEEQRAGSLSSMVTAGVPVDLSMEILGYDLTEEQWARLKEHLAEKQAQAAEMADAFQQRDGSDDDTGREKPEKVESETKAVGDAMLADLRKWRTKSVKRGKLAEFESEDIPDGIKAQIVDALDGFDNEDKIKSVFDSAIEGEPIKGRFIPRGADEPLLPIPDRIEFSEADIEAAMTHFDKIMPEYAGMLDTEVIGKVDYDGEQH